MSQDRLLPPSAMQIVTRMPHCQTPPCTMRIQTPHLHVQHLERQQRATNTPSGARGSRHSTVPACHSSETLYDTILRSLLAPMPACQTSLRETDARHMHAYTDVCQTHARQTPRHARYTWPRHARYTSARHKPPIHTQLPTALILHTSESGVRASGLDYVGLTTRLKHASERDGKHASIVERDGGGGRFDGPSLSPSSCPHIITRMHTR